LVTSLQLCLSLSSYGSENNTQLVNFQQNEHQKKEPLTDFTSTSNSEINKNTEPSYNQILTLTPTEIDKSDSNSNPNIDVKIYTKTLPKKIIDEISANPNADLIYIESNTPIEVHPKNTNFPKNWWVTHHSKLQTAWCLIRYTLATGAFYVGLISFSQFSLPTIIAGSQIAGLMSLLFMHKNIVLNNWITKNKSWAIRIIRYFFLSVLFISVIKIGIIGSEVFLTKSNFIDNTFILKEFTSIAYSSFIGTITQGFWGLWNAQYQENNLKNIDKTLPLELQKYQKEVIEMKSNFISFFNSIVNNTFSAIIATGGNMLILDIISYMISASGVVAFISSYAREPKCNNLL
jgi:hypothetical protein